MKIYRIVKFHQAFPLQKRPWLRSCRPTKNVILTLNSPTMNQLHNKRIISNATGKCMLIIGWMAGIIFQCCIKILTNRSLHKITRLRISHQSLYRQRQGPLIGQESMLFILLPILTHSFQPTDRGWILILSFQRVSTLVAF